MITPNFIFSGAPQVTVIPSSYPGGRMNDETSPGAEDGAYVLASLMNDYNGFLQACVYGAGLTPSQVNEAANSSQALEGIKVQTVSPRAPQVAGVVTAEVADTWAAESDSVNINSITTPTGTPGFVNGNLLVTHTAGGTSVEAQVSPSAPMARKGLIVGADRESVGVTVGASSAYGHRATISFNGSAWSQVDVANVQLNSDSVTLTKAANYVRVEWPDVDGQTLADMWQVSALGNDHEEVYTCRQVAGKAGKAVDIYFKPIHPVRGIIAFSGAVPALVSGSWNGVGVSYDAGDKELTITHPQRSGPAHATLGKGSPFYAGLTVVAEVVSSTQTKVYMLDPDAGGAKYDLSNSTLHFTREIGGTEYVDVQSMPTLIITNGLGAVAQDFATLLGSINVSQDAKPV